MVRQRILNVRKTPYRLRSQAKCVKMLLQQYQYRQAVAIAMTVHIRYLRRQVIRRHLLWVRNNSHAKKYLLSPSIDLLLHDNSMLPYKNSFLLHLHLYLHSLYYIIIYRYF